MPDEFRKKLIEDHMEMAGAIASECLVKYNLASLLPYDDLLAYARAGLVEAANNFDPSSGATFRSYSWARIKGEVLDGVRRNSRYSRAYRRDEHDSDDDVSARPATVKHPLVNGEDDLADTASVHYCPEEAVDAARLRTALLRAVEGLPARDRDIILRHYFRGEDIKDIAKHYGFWVHSIVRIHSRSLSQLRTALAESLTANAQVLVQ